MVLNKISKLTLLFLAILSAINIASYADDSADEKSGVSSAQTTITPAPSHHLTGITLEDPEEELSSISKPDARCKTSKLTQDKFLEMIKAIVAHGDVTDRDFVEKTLHVKFGPKNKISGRQTEDAGFYFATLPSDTHNNPLWVVLYIGNLPKDKDGNLTIYDRLEFGGVDMVGAAFSNCKYLTEEQMKHKFGDTLHDRFIDLGKIGKDGSGITIDYSLKLFKAQTVDAVKTIVIGHRSYYLNK